MNFLNIFFSLFSFKSFRGRLAWSFLGLFILFCLSSVAYISFFKFFILKDYQFVVEKSIPSRHYCSLVESQIRRTTSSLQNYIHTDSDYFRKERAKIWNVQFTPSMDSLTVYSQIWEDHTISGLVSDLKVKSQRLKMEQDIVEDEHFKKLLNTETQKDRAEKFEQLSIMEGEIQGLIDLIINLQQQDLKRAREQVQFHSDHIFYVLTPVFCLIFFLAVLIAAAFLIRTLRKSTKEVVNNLNELSKGNIPSLLLVEADEVQEVAGLVNHICTDLGKLNNFAREVGEGDFEANFESFSKDSDVGSAFLQMRDSLKAVAERDRKNNWVIAGIAHFAEVIRTHNSGLDELCEAFASELVRYLKAYQSSIYISNQDYSPPVLELKAWYAFDVKKYRTKVIEQGEGILGEAFREKRTVMITKIPEEYMIISSGLGEAPPACVLIVPLRVSDLLVGMAEIASFKVFEPHEIKFVEKVAESLASEVTSVHISDRTQRLLEEAQLRSEMLRAQEEEMRQNMEELQATQEEMERKELESKRMLESSTEREVHMKDRIVELSEKKEQLERELDRLNSLRNSEIQRYETTILGQKEQLTRMRQKNTEERERLFLRIRDLEKERKKYLKEDDEDLDD